MADSPVMLETLPWRKIFPWLHVTRAFWIAVDLRKLLLAAAGLLLVSAGSLLFDQLPFGQAGHEALAHDWTGSRWPWQTSLNYSVSRAADGTAEVRDAIDHPVLTLLEISGNWRAVLHPVRSIVEPAAALFRGGASMALVADAVTRLSWALVVWSIFGGAIARIAAVQFARDQRVGMRAALAFSLSRFFGFLSAPLLPAIAVLILWALCVIGGWLGRIPGGVGDAILGGLWGLELIFGLMMAVVLVGLTAGWPLMFATIAVEGTDGFDGLSRMYNYVFERPLYYLWQVIVALVYGSVVIFFVWLMARGLVHLTVWAVSWGRGYDATLELIAGAPPLVVGGRLGAFGPTASLGADMARGWMCALATLVVGFVYSYFWTVSTILYFTLRKSIDASEFDEVFVEDDNEPDELLPLVGTAAMNEAAAVRAGETPPPTPPDAPPVDLTP